MAAKTKKQKTGLGGSNRGSGIVNVLVAVAFVSALAAALLFLSYMNLQIKISDRASRANFYTAETAVSEVRAKLQEYATKAIAEAYTQVLTDYNASAAEANRESFGRAFVQALNKLGGSDAINISIPAGTQTGTGSYQIDKIWPDIPANITATAGGAAVGTMSASLDTREIVFHGLSVTCVERGYETTVSTDMVIKMPDFSYTMADYSMSHLYEYIIVADTGVTQQSKTISVDGNVYAGKVDLGGSLTSLVLKGRSTLVTGRLAEQGYGHIAIDGGANLNIAADGVVWARQIRLEGTGSTLSVNGDAYVADDMAVQGNNASVAVTGRYYGFGQQSRLLSETDRLPANQRDGSLNSSITISGQNASLDFSQAETMLLAGYSFIEGTRPDGPAGADILMGGSISVKSDQTAYLVPDRLITTNGVAGGRPNPFVLPAAEQNPVITVDTSTDFFWSAADNAFLSLSDMGATYATRIYKLPSTGDSIVYTFMVFERPSDAAEYFKDYYSENSEKVDKYLDYYIQSIDLGQLLPQGVYYSQAGGSFGLETPAQGSAATIASIAPMLRNRYSNMISTLSETSASIGTPFNHFVNGSLIDSTFRGNAPVEFEVDGKVLGLIIPSDYYSTGTNASFDIGGSTEYNTKYKDVDVIIAMGDVKVSREFTGLIMAEGTVDLGASISTDTYMLEAGREHTEFTFKNATTSENGVQNLPLINYMVGGDSYAPGGTTAGGEVSWELDQMVVYKNWKKN